MNRDPLFTDDYPIPKKRRCRTPKKDSEAAVLRECLIYLRDIPRVVYVERRNTGAIAFADGGFMRFGTPGGADIWCLIRCLSTQLYPTGWICTGNVDSSCSGSCFTHIEIEVKRRDGKGKLSSAQQSFKRFCEKSGIPYFVVTSKENLIEQLKEAGFLS